MPLHKDLTGADLHEPKGITGASADTVYVADGIGGGSWDKVPASGIDGSSVLNLNREQMFTIFTDIGTAGSQYLGIAKKCSIVKIVAVLQAATATADTILTFRNDAGTSMGTITIPSGATAGAVYTVSPVTNNAFVADTKFQIQSDGGTSTTPNVQFTLELVWS